MITYIQLLLGLWIAFKNSIHYLSCLLKGRTRVAQGLKSKYKSPITLRNLLLDT